MRSVVKAIIMLPVRIILLPIELALIMASWIAIFFTSMTEWIFNLEDKWYAGHTRRKMEKRLWLKN